MGRRHKVDEIHLQIDDLVPFVNEKYMGFIIEWSSDIGFGEYTVYRTYDSEEWKAESEHMDNNEDKDFIKELMKLFIAKLDVEE